MNRQQIKSQINVINDFEIYDEINKKEKIWACQWMARGQNWVIRR